MNEFTFFTQWVDRIANGQLPASDRMTAERDFPTILSVFERLFKPEINETA